MIKKPIYRPGDRVIIMQPQVFVRCGYPFDMMTETDDFMRLYPATIREFLRSVGIKWDGENLSDIRSLCGRLARLKAVQEGYGGNERRIYTRFEADILGKEGTVYSKRFVKTGNRYGPSSGPDEDGGWYEPGGLSDEKTHAILQVYGTGVTMFEIEAANVRHVAS